MCNLYRLTKAHNEVARWFGASNELVGTNIGAEVFPGNQGAVVADGKLRQMSWGFPLVLKSKKTGKPLKPRPVNNARCDKLESFIWRYSFEERRCVIPLSAWAEAEGPVGHKTRSWLSRPDSEIFAAAGVWRNSDEWGAVYAMVMTDATGVAADVHTRMPVLLSDAHWATWTNGTPREARKLCAAWSGELALDRTNERW